MAEWTSERSIAAYTLTPGEGNFITKEWFGASHTSIIGNEMMDE
jgi:hypothetical protein